MFDLLRRASDICAKYRIDPATLISVSNIYDFFKNEKCLYGTVLKYEKGDAMVIFITLVSGWYKQYVFRSEKLDSIRIIRDLERNSFSRRMISDIMGMSRDELERLTTCRKEKQQC